jgi:hypothetical protein
MQVAGQGSVEVPRARLRKLLRYNTLMGGLHLGQAILVLALATAFALPVTASFLAGPPGTAPEAPSELFSINVAWAVAAFLIISSLAHVWLVTAGRRKYARDLRQDRNDARWVEYAVSASIMMVLIAMLTGISDVAALIAICGVNASMILFGLVQERMTQPGRTTTLLPFWMGCIAGIVPWLAVGVYLVSPGSTAEPPAFVYAIFISLFVFFNSFAVNQYLQYRQIGKWKDYLFGESVYVTLSLVAKSALAWQVFAGTLAG